MTLQEGKENVHYYNSRECKGSLASSLSIVRLMGALISILRLLAQCQAAFTSSWDVTTCHRTRFSDRVLQCRRGRRAAVSSRIFLAAEEQEEGEETELLPDLSWRVEKLRLEEANTRTFLKRKPRKLPYEDARLWIQANIGVETKEEYEDIVANGELRTPYIPKRPEEYYTATREWVSWDHFLRGIFDEAGDRDAPSGVKPATGIFD